MLGDQAVRAINQHPARENRGVSWQSPKNIGVVIVHENAMGIRESDGCHNSNDRAPIRIRRGLASIGHEPSGAEEKRQVRNNQSLG